MVEQSGGAGRPGVPPPRRVRPPGASGTPPTSDPETAARRRTLWERIAGDGSHLGFWTLPVFVATALGGAVIAGGLAQVYYGQQVAQLEEETAAARNAAERAAQDIDEAREAALDEIGAQVDGVRDALEAARPLEDPAAEGVVALTVELTPPPAPAQSPPPQQQQPPPDPSPQPQPTQPAGDGEAQGAPDVQAASTTDGPAPSTRRASGFVVALDGGTSFVATSYGAVADPNAPDGVAPSVIVSTPATGEVAGVVHAWDEQRGVAIVRVDIAELPILPWRPFDTPVDAGEVVVLAAVTPSLVGVQLPGRVGAATDEALLTDLPVDPAFDGAPLLDSTGRVVGLQASTASPFGPGSRGALAARLLCVELINGCDLLVQAADEDDEDAG